MTEAIDAVRVLFEHERFVCLHKPAGIPFHSESGVVGVVEQARTLLDSASLFPVHRLDRLTSGLMLFARDTDANSQLSQLFEQRLIDKTYLALSLYKPKKKQGRIMGDMARARRGAWKLQRTQDNPALTRFQCLGKLSMCGGAPVWAFALYPKTGQTHQLRVAMKSIGSPILGDGRYGAETADRGYLHAWRLKFLAFDRSFELTDPDFIGARVSVEVLLSALK